MKGEQSGSWLEINQRGLSEALAEVLDRLKRHAAHQESLPLSGSEDAGEGANGPLALDRLCAIFGLSPFERQVLVLCAGIELDAQVAAVCAEVQGDPARRYPTFSLALAGLPGAHWNALTPAGPLRRWRLIEMAPGHGLTVSPLRIDERILHYLVGIDSADERLLDLTQPVPVSGVLVASHQAQADQIVAAWGQAPSRTTLPVVQLVGEGGAAKRAVAAEACAQSGLRLFALPAEALPTAPGELEPLVRLWEREAALTASALLLDCDSLENAGPEGGGAERTGIAARLIERITGPFFVAVPERRSFRQRSVITLEIGKPALEEQHALWEAALGPEAAGLDEALAHLTAHFDVGLEAVRAASLSALAETARLAAHGEAVPLETALWNACRVGARTSLDNLAERVEAKTTWDDLILPKPQQDVLHDILANVRRRSTVYQTWGFGGRSTRGLGVTALFSGESGTGKTTAAEVLARELSLDLYKIDLSAVVSKYIGESEKNLRRVFDAAEAGGAILLFDEADALFGKRTEVKDSHDRYANLEVSYLLQRMEAYPGLAILTTNLKSSIDTAFLRRIRFVVQFPFPTTVERAEIWRRVYPASVPTDALAPEKLARLNVAGGTIRNIALGGAFLAAEAGEPVRMIHLLRAAQTEYAKLEKTLTQTETADWI